MESEYLFEIYYGGKYVQSIIACTKWEAVDRVYHYYADKYQNLNRSLFKAKRK